jgi:uncharacterized protein YdeI (YjbR/CyaY-like superfamily)
MPTKDPAIDAYIQKAAPFAKPILTKIRALVHTACPAATETIKWGFPHFMHADAILCSMASFKNHCAFGFWKASLLRDPHGILHLTDKNSMGHFDRLSDVKDLPSDKIMIAYIKEAAGLNEEKIKPKARPRKPVAVLLEMPETLSAALKKNKKAQDNFNLMSPSRKNEYIEWIADAKTETTREKRIAQTMEWLKEGKSRNWQYQKT